ncbi:MAG: hypothetical protein M3O71_08080 [Bacteroidota bacterium]|nr:hypothetical protein [Bacteroidota bacterium]
MLGIITIALGEKRYIEMAKMLALSLIHTNPGIKRAIVSDAGELEFTGLYDTYIPYDRGLGKGLSNKLYLDKYSPFQETLFIDSDCLVFTSLDAMIDLSRRYPFVVFGDQITSGDWYMDVAAMCKKFSLPSVPLFNGGTYYFNDKVVAANIYDKARELAENYKTLGFTEFRGSINEEPLVSVAMAINHVDAVDDKGIGMRTPIGLIGPLKIDVLNKQCSFNKQGEHVEPAIMHFAGSYAIAFHYKRETAKLKMARSLPFINKKLLSFVVNSAFNLPYGFLVFFKRIVKTILRKEKFDFSNTLPAFSNQ